MCEYKARAMTDCAIWRKQDVKVFTDNCNTYVMSQPILKTVLDSKYP